MFVTKMEIKQKKLLVPHCFGDWTINEDKLTQGDATSGKRCLQDKAQFQHILQCTRMFF